jgi:hypothetical protein
VQTNELEPSSATKKPEKSSNLEPTISKDEPMEIDDTKSVPSDRKEEPSSVTKEAEKSILKDDQQDELLSSTHLAPPSTKKKIKKAKKTPVTEPSSDAIFPELDQTSDISNQEELIPPKVIYPLYDKTVILGEKVSLKCQIEASPQPNIEWFRDDHKLSARKNQRIHFAENLNVYALKLTDAEADDAGIYSCKSAKSR